MDESRRATLVKLKPSVKKQMADWVNISKYHGNNVKSNSDLVEIAVAEFMKKHSPRDKLRVAM